MMKCVGTPNGPCPCNAFGASVHFRFAELDLCSPSEKVQREATMKASGGKSPVGNQPQNRNASNNRNQSSINKASQVKAKENKSAPINDDNVKLMSRNTDNSLIVSPLLSYILFSLHSGTEENVQRAVLGNFTAAQVIVAKDQLWDKCEEQHIGKKSRCVGPSMRPEQDILQDIFLALDKLDKMQKMPTVVIPAFQLHLIPCSHPEELNNMSLLDRLNCIEKTLAHLQFNTDRVIAENISINERLTNQLSYASAVQSRASLTASAKDIYTIKTQDPPPIRRHPNSSIQHRSNDDKFWLPPPVKSPPKGSIGKSLNDTPETDCVSMADSSGFQFPRRRRRKVIVGKDRSSGAVKAAPEPNHDVFIYRVDKSASDDSLYDYLIDKGITPNSLDCVSNPDSRYKSYKLSIPLSMYSTLYDPDMWPEGLRIIRSTIPRT